MSSVDASIDGNVGILTLNRPARLNALDEDMVSALAAGLAAHAKDRRVGAVLITGAGEGFCSGVDVELLPTVGPGKKYADLASLVEATFYPIIRTLARYPKPTLAFVNGQAAGAGLSLALACDFRLATTSARFVSAFTRLGLCPDSGATFFLSRLLGPARALEVAALNETIAAERAREIGLVNWVEETDGYEAALFRAESVARVPAQAFVETRALFFDPDGRALEAALEAEKRALNRLGASEAHAAAVARFLRPA